ncbi:hypothetical protein NC651_030875 [Populus alba x Populus x berolinensis]|nr:hypothetical protein NC651_030875 [Populus alba x Populus x berolinensis]
MVYRRSAFAFFGYSIFFLDLKSSYSSIAVPCLAGSRYHAFSLPDGEQENQSQICPSPYISIPFMSIVKIARYSSLRMLCVMHKNIRIASDPVLLEVAVANEHWVNESRKHQTMRPLKLLENGSPKELQGVLIKRFYSKNLKG